ncbi:glycoside hydrolase family 65 protein [Paraburkholderia phenazinium]|uniref:glycoside hydrolase family 65 protein n=1 Tax=Paraburkholderia phenazinium TaxID=60549 RepID=UPI001588E211|nr:glycoside hydrolase family 65 protein [Paraburkholderia phenazinium]
MTGPWSLDHALTPTNDRDWIIEEAGYDPLREASRGARFAISNGFLGVRGARAIHRGGRWVDTSRTLVAGLFDTPDDEQAIPGLVATPDWLQVRISLQGEPLVHRPGDGESQRRILDMRRGTLITEDRLSNASDVGVRLRSLHIVSLDQRAIGLQLLQLEIEQGEVEVTLNASFEGLDIGLVSERVEPGLGVWHVISTGKRLAIAVGLTLQIDGQEVPANRTGPFHWSWCWKSQRGQIGSLERIVAMTRSETENADAGQQARAALCVARELGWSDVMAAHERAWVARWEGSDVTIEGDPAAQQALRFALYHLNGAANPADERVSIAARALTGDDYRGHVFWDTEIYLLPFYILTWPEAARALLMYRFRTLDGARAKAAGMGWRGALYAWESADTGAETSPLKVIGPDRKVVNVRCGEQEQHISADVAYAVWQYWQATGDEIFLRDAGAEILLETARFWSSRAQVDADGHCHIRGVIGPDEYHESIDDNAFTNVMARWNIRRALEVAALLCERWPQTWESLSGSLGLEDGELKQWRSIADTIVTGLDPSTGLFEQFAGFFALEYIDLDDYPGRSVPMDVVLGRERTQKSQVVKQADVVALLVLLPEEFPGDSGAKNFDYYARRCGHGSSLSRAMHGIVAGRLGRSEVALDFFRGTSAIDLEDSQASIDGGVHIAGLGGIWLMAVFGFGGLSLHSDHLALDPKLPSGWKTLAFSVQWRSRKLRIRIMQATGSVEATLEGGEPMKLVVGGKAFNLDRSESLQVSLDPERNDSPDKNPNARRLEMDA